MPSRKKAAKSVFPATVHVIILGIVFVLQLLFVAFLSNLLRGQVWWLTVIWYTLAFLAGFYVNARHDNPSTKLFWILLIVLFPAFGLLLYITWGYPRASKRKLRLIRESSEAAEAALFSFAKTKDDPESPLAGVEINTCTNIRNTSAYLTTMGFPLMHNTEIEYFPAGELLFDDCLEKLKTARRSIFLSFFILKEGKLWNQFYEILLAKAQSGVEIRLLIDDAGTMFNLSEEFIRNLEKDGIHVAIFNPTHRYLNTIYLNYRTHQKLIIIDSNIGYTGGVNLADEYANYTSPYGYWKDTGVRLTGDGVFGMTTIFLDMWDQIHEQPANEYGLYRPTTALETPGLCHVFADGPSNNPKNPAEGIIFRLIESARESIYLTTPYLVISQAMVDTLCRTAQSGVRVAVIVPYQLDHWYVFEVTQSHFPALIDAGVEIYRYSPGMLHAKLIVVDGTEALVSTINLDNRSFYSQYEDGVWFCGCEAVSAAARDIEDTIAVSQRVTRQDCDSLSVMRRFLGMILRLFSPLM